MAVVVTQSSLDGTLRNAIAVSPPFDDIMTVELIKSPFVASRTTVLADLVPADFPGYAARDTAAAALLLHDPLTNEWWLVLSDPEGGWVWAREAGAGDPQTIYGVRVTGIGCALIPPVVISAVDDIVVVGEIHIPLGNILAS